MSKQVVIGMIVAGTAMCASGGERYTEKHQLDAKHTIVVAEGEYEVRSIGSYTIRLYKVLSPEHPTDNFVCGSIRPRDGVVEDVILGARQNNSIRRHF